MRLEGHIYEHINQKNLKTTKCSRDSLVEGTHSFIEGLNIFKQNIKRLSLEYFCALPLTFLVHWE